MALYVDRSLVPGDGAIEKSYSMKVRASPHAVGVRLSKFTRDCVGAMYEMLPARERAVLRANGNTPATGAPKWTCSGAPLSAPLLPAFVSL